jgi:hypothetical protein
MLLNSNKLTCYQKGLKAMSEIKKVYEEAKIIGGN